VRPRIQLGRPYARAGGHAPAHGDRGGAAYAHSQAARRTIASEVVAPGMRLGARVRHGKFGEGTVLNVEGQGPQARVQVNFERQGTKWLMLAYANLEAM